MKRINLPTRNPAKAYQPKPIVTNNEKPTMVQLKQLRQQAPVQFQQHITALQNTLGNQAVVQLLHQLEMPSPPATVHHAAAKGVQGIGSRLPHYNKIQRSFGKHDISRVQAYTGQQSAAANAVIGSKAYATGNKIAFAESTPDLHTAAHEAAHVIQQQAGVQLKGGVGKSGDKYERHADKVADLVVRGQSVQAALDTMANKGSASAGSQSNVQTMVKKILGMGGSDKKAKDTATLKGKKFQSAIKTMSKLLDTGPVFIGESHDRDYGTEAVIELIKLNKVDKLFLELRPFGSDVTGDPTDHIKTEKEFKEIKWRYELSAQLQYMFRGTTAKRYRAITEYALENKVEVYHADMDSDKTNIDDQDKERNKHTSDYIRTHTDKKGARTVVLGGVGHYVREELNPIHHQLGYKTEKPSRFFNLSAEEYIK